MDPYIELPKVPIVIGRQDFVLARCKGKQVLHLGCVDSNLLLQRFLAGELMHQKLAQVSDELWGVDVDEQGIDFLLEHGIDNVVVGDVCNLDNIPDLQGRRFDVIVASEIIEHLMNPGLFSKAVKNLMRPGHTELIVTVPNAFRVSTLIQLLRGVEYVHLDHNYWFSYHTVTNLLKKGGFDIEEVCVYSFTSPKILPRRIGKFFSKGVRPVRKWPKSSSRKDTKIGLVSGGGTKSPSTSIFIRAIRYCKLLPRRLLISLLYRITPFFGDGIILVCKRIS